LRKTPLFQEIAERVNTMAGMQISSANPHFHRIQCPCALQPEKILAYSS
jgi:hypothetical protein